MKQRYTTERLTLTPTSVKDAEFIFKLMNTPQWIQYIGDRNIRNTHDAQVYITEKMLPQIKSLGFGNYTVSKTTNGEKLGTCGLYNRAGFEGVDIGFAFLPQHHGKGYAYESASKLLELAKTTFNLEYINGITAQENSASRALLTKLGLKFIKKIQLPNEDIALLLYQKGL